MSPGNAADYRPGTYAIQENRVGEPDLSAHLQAIGEGPVTTNDSTSRVSTFPAVESFHRRDRAPNIALSQAVSLSNQAAACRFSNGKLACGKRSVCRATGLSERCEPTSLSPTEHSRPILNKHAPHAHLTRRPSHPRIPPPRPQ